MQRSWIFSHSRPVYAQIHWIYSHPHSVYAHRSSQVHIFV
ncbi:hypothetical protein JOC48_004028 [Aquibacillus albus]|uniref:Uncharacterized protein n=1 Tax=Aquibacillus albus TaxID=1168171 RepID=A0ABS2N5R6_9BACI|nr:hypothetical protein [Aquibacillus albus]